MPSTQPPLHLHPAPLHAERQDNVEPLDTVEISAGPFRTFRELGAFQEMLEALPGIVKVRPRRVSGGLLYVRVEHTGLSQVVNVLRARSGMVLQRVVPHCIDLRYADSDEGLDEEQSA